MIKMKALLCLQNPILQAHIWLWTTLKSIWSFMIQMAPKSCQQAHRTQLRPIHSMPYTKTIKWIIWPYRLPQKKSCKVSSRELMLVWFALDKIKQVRTSVLYSHRCFYLIITNRLFVISSQTSDFIWKQSAQIMQRFWHFASITLLAFRTYQSVQ